jgi:hypothetical protein
VKEHPQHLLLLLLLLLLRLLLLLLTLLQGVVETVPNQESQTPP